MAEVRNEHDQALEKDEWRRAAFIAATIMNSAGKSYRQTIRPDQLLQFNDDGRKRWSAKERDRRRREAQETLKIHKAKFWTKFKDSSVEKLTEN